MGSLFDFERICVNCRWYGTSWDDPGQACCHPSHGIVWADEDETCEDWETKVEHAARYLADENGRIYEKEV